MSNPIEDEEREFRTASYLHYPTGNCAGRVRPSHRPPAEGKF